MKNGLMIIAMMLVISIPGFSQDTVKYKPVQYPEGFTSKIDVIYTTAKDWEGRMDLYLPPASKGPSPIVINIHGGGWNKGVKESQTGFSTFFKMGYAVANIEYRLSDQASAPAAVEDARCALIYLIKNAKELNIDVNKIVIMGGSAGGHLALMAGLLGNDHRFDTNCPGVENIKVAAIINKYGITNVWDWGNGERIRSKSMARWLGDRKDDRKFAMSVSPINYINKDNPPVFIVHGDADPVVPYEHSVDLHKKLKDVGVKTEFMTVEGGLHGKFTKEQNSEVNKAITKFLKELGLDN
jgi:acetyl esterase/lipase